MLIASLDSRYFAISPVNDETSLRLIFLFLDLGHYEIDDQITFRPSAVFSYTPDRCDTRTARSQVKS
jgi:hypothetical protein